MSTDLGLSGGSHYHNPPAAVYSEDLAFSPDGANLASSARYNSLVTQLWGSQTGQLLRNIDSSQIGIIHFTADGKLLVLLRLQDGIVQLWGIPPK
jgi:WD40 repeat protein